MNSGKTIFAQLMDFVSAYEFRKCVDQYNGNFKMKSFSCWDQYLCMAFAQLTYRESLRDIEACLRATQSKLYHLGIRGKVSRNTLAHANQTRDWRIYADFAQILITRTRKLYAEDTFGIELDQAVYALDSTTIDLCLALFPWAEFRKRKGAIKLHTLLDLRGSIPSVIIITTGKVHDVKYPGQLDHRSWGHLRHGSRLSRFWASVQGPSEFGILRYANKKELQPQAPVFQSSRQIPRRPVRPDCYPQGLLCQERLPGKTPTHWILRFKEQQNACVFDQQFCPAGQNNCRSLSLPMASGAVFQMDQATSQDQGFLWHHRKRRKDSSLDRYLRLRPRSYRQKRPESRPKSLHNFTGFERHPF